MKFFFDNCVSPRVVEALRCLDPRHEYVHLRDRFPQDADDETWITELAREGGWVIVSSDPRISRGKAERAAWIESGLTAFFCGSAWSERKLLTQAAELLRLWDQIVERALNAAPGSGYLLEFRAAEPRQIYPEATAKRRKKR